MRRRVVSQKVAATLCPLCGALLDGVTGVHAGKHVPQRGDFSLCLYCTGILRYGDKGRLHAVAAPELDQVRTEQPELVALLERGQHQLRRERLMTGPIQAPPFGRA